MAMNHQISSNVHDRYHGAGKAKELHSQKKHEHGNMRAGQGKEGSKPELPVRERHGPDGGGKGSYQLHERKGDHGHGNDGVKWDGKIRYLDKSDINLYKPFAQKATYFSYEELKTQNNCGCGASHGTSQSYQFTQITMTNSNVFSGAHFDSPEKSLEAHKNFINAALDFIKNPGEKSYQSLNEAMMKLMDPKFAPAINGGAAQVSVLTVNGTTMAKFTMEVTPAPTKSLDEAREDLKNAFSSKRNGEENIDSIRAEAHANYIRALSEKFKKDGVISHTNNAPTTPVFKSSVIYVSKVTKANENSMIEIRKPQFVNNFHGKLSFKNQNNFWNDHRNNHKSYFDILSSHPKKTYGPNASKLFNNHMH